MTAAKLDGKWIKAHLPGEWGEQVDLAKEMGIDSAKLSKTLAGIRRLQPDEIPGVVRFFRARNLPLPPPYDTTDPEPEGDLVPVYDLAASAGGGLIPSGEEPLAYELRFPAGYLRQLTGANPAHVRSLGVRGDSMEPTLRDGDLVLIDTSSASAGPDGLYVIRVDEAIMVKRLGRAGPGRLLLISDNRTYPPSEYPIDEVVVIGRVLGAVVRM